MWPGSLTAPVPFFGEEDSDSFLNMIQPSLSESRSSKCNSSCSWKTNIWLQLCLQADSSGHRQHTPHLCSHSPGSPGTRLTAPCSHKDSVLLLPLADENPLSVGTGFPGRPSGLPLGSVHFLSPGPFHPNALEGRAHHEIGAHYKWNLSP